MFPPHLQGNELDGQKQQGRPPMGGCKCMCIL